MDEEDGGENTSNGAGMPKHTIFSHMMDNDDSLAERSDSAMGNNDHLSVPSSAASASKQHKKTTEVTNKVECDLINVKNVLEDNIIDIFQKKKQGGQDANKQSPVQLNGFCQDGFNNLMGPGGKSQNGKYGVYMKKGLATH